LSKDYISEPQLVGSGIKLYVLYWCEFDSVCVRVDVQCFNTTL